MKILLLLIVLGFLGFQLHTLMLKDLRASETGVLQPYAWPLGPSDPPKQIHTYEFFKAFGADASRQVMADVISKTAHDDTVTITNTMAGYSITLPRQYKYTEEYTDRRPLLVGSGPGTQQVVEIKLNSPAEYRQPKVLLQLKTIASNGTYEEPKPLQQNYISLENYKSAGFNWWVYGYSEWYAAAYGPILDGGYSVLLSIKIEADDSDADAAKELKQLIDRFERIPINTDTK